MAEEILKAKKSDKAVQKEQPIIQASQESQARLAEILSDAPRLVSLNGTEWEVRALRFGTQWLIADKVCKMNQKTAATMGDIMRDFQTDIPAVVEVITLALLNDKRKIFDGGDEASGYSALYKSTYDTLLWECPVGDFANILLEVLQMLDINFTMDAAATLQMLTASVTMKKRNRMKGQRPSTQSPS